MAKGLGLLVCMNNFEFNKIFASLLVALLCMQVFHLIADYLVHPVYLSQNLLGIDGGAQVVTSGGASEQPLEPVAPMLATANVVNGEKTAKKCLQCHSFAKGGPHKTGPNLWGIVMNAVAHAADYAYSQAMKAHGGNWDYEALNTYLHKPREYIKGTKMSFVGLANAQERADLIAYLRSQADNPVPLP